MTDFIKLAIPTTRLWKRLAVVAFDPNLPVPSNKWFALLTRDRKLEFLIDLSDESLLKIKTSESKDPPQYARSEFDDREEIKRISEQFADYEIPNLKLEVTLHSREVSKNSVTVMVFSVERK